MTGNEDMKPGLNEAVQAEEEEGLTIEELERFRIDPNEEVEEPPEVLRINGQLVASQGNISLLIGKAKSKKSFLCVLLADAAIQSGKLNEPITGKLDSERREVLYIDTEQGKYHATKQAKRIAELSGKPNALHFYALRELSTPERFNAIEPYIQHHPEAGLVIIDGIRDLATCGINDEANATEIADLLLKLSSEYSVHIACVLHQNKGDTNARGHLGTELQNKAETVLSIAESEKEKEVSIASPEYTRNKEPGDLAFTITKGLPQVLPDWIEPADNNPNSRKRPDEIPGSTLRQVVSALIERFGEEANITRKELIDALSYQVGRFIEPEGIGENTARKYIEHFRELEAITYSQQQKKYCFNVEAFD